MLQGLKCCTSLWRFQRVFSNAVVLRLAPSPGWILLLMATAVYLSGFWIWAGWGSPQAAAKRGRNRTAVLGSGLPSNRHQLGVLSFGMWPFSFCSKPFWQFRHFGRHISTLWTTLVIDVSPRSTNTASISIPSNPSVSSNLPCKCGN